MMFIQLNKGVHLQFFRKVCVIGKIAVRVVQKKSFVNSAV
jgi:hypothetical protein